MESTKSVGSQEMEPYPVGRFTRTVVRSPIQTMIVCFLAAMSCASMGIVFAGGFSGSFTDLTDPIVKKMYGVDRAVYSWTLALTGTDEEESVESTAARQTEAMANPIQVIIKSKSGKALGPSALKWFAKIQNEVVSFDAGGLKYTDYCLRSSSDLSDTSCKVPSSPAAIANSASASPASPSSDCSCATTFGVTCANIDASCTDFGVPSCAAKVPASPPPKAASKAAFTALCKAEKSYSGCESDLYSLRLDTVGKNFNCDTLETNWARLLLPYGVPFLDGEYDEEIQEEKRETFEDALLPVLYGLKKEAEEDDPDLEIYYWNLNQIGYYLNNDLRFVMMGIFFVFTLLFWQTESLFVSSCGLFEILISYPCGLFVWHVIFQQPYVTYLMYSGIFVILGIGADDIFVLSDAFKQASLQPPHISGSLETRFAWAYNRAASAMLATSLTTCAAFASCAVSPIWDIAAFGCVAATMILADYLLVITWLPAAMIVNERYLQNCCTWCAPKHLSNCLMRCMGIKRGAHVAEKETAEKAAITERRAYQVESVEKQSSSFNTPVTELGLENGEGGIELKVSTSGSSLSSSGEDNTVFSHDKPSNAAPRMLEEFYSGPYADFVIKHAKVIVAFFACLLVASIVTTLLCIEADTEQTSFFEDSHFWVKSQSASGDRFGVTASEEVSFLPIKLSFGLKPTDPWSLDGVHPCDVRTDVASTKAHFKPKRDLADHQVALSEACASFMVTLTEQGNADATSGAPGYDCWIDDFKAWLTSTKGRAFPVVPAADFRALAVEWRDTQAADMGFRYAFATGFLEDGERVTFSFASFNTTATVKDLLRGALGFGDMWELYDDAEAARKDAEAASQLDGAVQAAPFYAGMVSGQAFLTAAISNLTAGLLLAVLVIGGMTLNWKLTGIAVLALANVVSLVFFLMVVFQWKINVIESIGISLAAGMAVDYVLHLAHSYNHQSGADPAEKVRGCLAEMGISITYGCITSFSACVALYLCDFLWFKIFGYFITMIITSSFFVSMLGMMAALVCFGPGEAPDGEIKLPAWMGGQGHTQDGA